MTKLGDKKTLYSYADDRVREHEVSCVGFTPDKTPVWHCKVMKVRGSLFEAADLYVMSNKVGRNEGFYETVEEVLEHLRNLADLRDVQNEHLRTKLNEAGAKWEEKSADD